MSPLWVGVAAWSSSAFALALGLGAVLGGALAVVAWRRRPAAGTVPFAVFAAGVTAWSAADLANWLVPGAELSLLLSNLSYVGIVTVPAAWLAFALEYADGDRVGARTVALLSIEPLVLLALLWTGLGEGLLFAGSHVETVRGVSMFRREYGPLFWAHAAYSYLVILAGFVALVRRFAASSRLYRRQLSALALGAVVPWGANLCYLLRVPPFAAVDPTPVGFAVGSVPVFRALVRYRLFDRFPSATGVIHRTIDEGVAVLDRRNRVVDVDETLTELLGRSRDELVDRHASEVLPRWETIADAPDPEATVSREVEAEAGGGCWLSICLSPIVERGSVIGRVAVLEDVTERVRRERQLERSRARLEVLDRILRHDLRNDLNVILGTSKLLQEGADDVESRAETIERTAARLLSHSEKVRHIEWSLHGQEDPRPLELSEVIRSGADWLRSIHSEAEVTVDSPSEAWVRATESLPVALRNVLENAVVHNDSETPRVSIDVTASVHEVTIRISDDGPGIPPSELSVVERGAETQLDHLSGVGLWLVEWIVDDAGGEVGYETTDGEGTTVTITLEAASPPAPGRGDCDPSSTFESWRPDSSFARDRLGRKSASNTADPNSRPPSVRDDSDSPSNPDDPGSPSSTER
jgi:PAS domain S-box-containing protein